MINSNSSFKFGCFILLAALFLFLPFIRLHAQKLDATLASYADNYQNEKIYIHFDKKAYVPGETIWFKAYILSGFMPSTISKNFYIDWSDAEGNIIYHTAAPILESSAMGQFDIPASFQGKTIHVRAYTQWMQNFDSSFLYNTDLRIIQRNDLKVNSLPKINASIKFLPEGGDLVNGLRSKVAFKAVDQWDKPVSVSGIITDTKGNRIDSFQTIHDGMGYFMLAPVVGETYTANWTDQSGEKYTTSLPAAKSEGAVISIIGTGNKRNYYVQRSENTSASLKTCYVTATIQQQLVYRAKADLSNTSTADGSIPVDRMPSGVMVITLFDNDWVPLAERITFINNQDFFASATINVLADMKKRGKNLINIETSDILLTNMSLSITDASVIVDSTDNIVSHFLLTSDLRGNIYRPSYYFKNNSESIPKQLDLVMLTNGWRKIDWEAIAQNKLPKLKYQPDSSFLSFSGKVFGANAAQIKRAGTINIIFEAKDSSRFLIFSPLKPDGSFSEPGVTFYDTVRAFYQFNKASALSSKTKVSFYTGLFKPPVKMYGLTKTPWIEVDTIGLANAKRIAEEQEKMKGYTLQSVTVEGRIRRPIDILDEKYTRGAFRSMDAFQFDLVNGPGALGHQTVFSYLQGRVAGLNINTSETIASATWRNEPVQFFQDEIRMDASQLVHLSMNDVAYIKVFRPPFIGAFGGGPFGAIAVYTRRGDDVSPTPGSGLNFNTIVGYSSYKQFYSPNYANASEDNNEADLRTTLYWNPYLLMAAQTPKVSVEFYNNDFTKKMRVRLEGMNKDGKLVFFEKVFE